MVVAAGGREEAKWAWVGPWGEDSVAVTSAEGLLCARPWTHYVFTLPHRGGNRPTELSDVST